MEAIIMLGTFVWIIITLLIPHMYWQPSFGRMPERRIDLYETPRPKKPDYVIDMNKISLRELRILDKAYQGTERGESIHSIRKARIQKKWDERNRRMDLRQQLNDKLENPDFRHLPTSQLEDLVTLLK